MTYQEKSIQCADCGATFAFTVGEQEFFQTKGYTNEPKRCPTCRQSRKAELNGNSGYGSSRQMFPVKCGECGKDTTVPFEPRGDKPVYCSDCYRKIKVSR